MNILMDNRNLLDALAAPYMDREPLRNGGTVCIGDYKMRGSIPFDVNRLTADATPAIQRYPKDLDNTRNMGGGSALSMVNNPAGVWYGGEDGFNE